MRFVLVALLAFFSVQAISSPRSQELRINPARAIGIDAPITQNVNALKVRMLALASDKSGKPIDIVIDSPGGSVFAGFQFVNAMEEVKGMGVQIRCFVNGIAASMAFQIFVHCSERHALGRSFLLWHGVRTGVRGPVTSKVAASLHVDLQAIDNVILSELNEELGLDEDVILYHFDQETLHVGQNLAKLAPKFLTVHKFVSGLNEAMNNPAVLKNSQSNSIFELSSGSQNEDGDIEYIYRGKK